MAQGRTLSNYEALSTTSHQRIRKTATTVPGSQNRAPQNTSRRNKSRNDQQFRPPPAAAPRNEWPTRPSAPGPSRATGTNTTPPRLEKRPNDAWRQKGGQQQSGGTRNERRTTAVTGNACYTCGKAGHLQRDCPQKKEHKGMEMDEDSSPYPQPFIVPMKLNGVGGFGGLFDTGARQSDAPKSSCCNEAQDS